RLTMIAWLSGAPTSTTTPAAGTNSGVHDGSVIGATSTSPGSSAEGSCESSTTRARPWAIPGQPGMPCNVSPSLTTATGRPPRVAHVDTGGGVPSNTNG